MTIPKPYQSHPCSKRTPLLNLPLLPFNYAGLLDLQRAQEWVVTTKLGSSDKRPGTGSTAIAMPSCRLYPNELLWAMFTLGSGLYALLAGTAHLGLAVYLLVQGECPAAAGWCSAATD